MRIIGIDSLSPRHWRSCLAFSLAAAFLLTAANAQETNNGPELI